ncbi:protein-L-isoaspartate(D-aspartate) O-methyltransferase [Candidatus Woesearchaeota archaeon]|nr:protein-L-isoaspartate(D-aspartate) O-methyltransferase [Candidatus Woesearchaeota archaeon]
MHGLEEKKELLIAYWRERYSFTEAELEAFKAIQREEFMPKEFQAFAYQDTALPILRGKTISQPTTVMLMTHALELQLGEKVFEVGTGSGYQTALLAELVGTKGKVISCEVIPELVDFARENLKKAGITNVTIFEEDGSKGFPSEAPFDKIIITAASLEFPKELIEQLNVSGIIVGPVGDRDEQEMVKGIKQNNGKLALEFLGQFLFSPLYGRYGFEV